MAKKSSIQSATHKITGIAGKGPYMAREVMTGSKGMSRAHPGLDKATPHKMCTAHGTNGQSRDHNMGNLTGGYLIGKGCRTFKPESYRLAGPPSGNPKHASQPSGHKSKA